MIRCLVFVAAILGSTAVAAEGWDIKPGSKVQVRSLDGFKGIKFGMVLEELKSIGLRCSATQIDDTCSTDFSDKFTFLGEPSRVSVKILGGDLGREPHRVNPENNKVHAVERIFVSIEEPLQEITRTLQESLGPRMWVSNPAQTLRMTNITKFGYFLMALL